MDNKKTKHLESEIHHKLSEIISELDNEKASEATITDVLLNNDHSVVKVFVSFVKKNDEESFFELKKANSFIRKELAHSISIKKVPFIEFILDDMLEKINEMENLIQKTKLKD